MEIEILNFFHALVNGRRKKLQLRRIQNNDGNWLDDTDAIAEEAINFYTTQLHEEHIQTYFTIIDHIPTMIDYDQNKHLMAQPMTKEVKKAVDGLNGESASGLDGFTGCFFQEC